MIYIYTQLKQGHRWLREYQSKDACFACILGFTQTGLIPGISAAGATPEDRQFTAVADGEFLVTGAQSQPHNPLPYLTKGASPVFISRAVVELTDLPTYVFNTGLPKSPSYEAIDLAQVSANCISSGEAMSRDTVLKLYKIGLERGKKLAANNTYLIIGECVVGGTTTALGVLTGLGIDAWGMVNSSHPCCNHQQKWSVVKQGLDNSNLELNHRNDPFSVVAALGDPMQIVAAGMAISASLEGGVLLAGGTQMLAVFALIKSIIKHTACNARLEQIVVGTTRWVAEDSTGNTVELARQIGDVSLLATGLSFAASKYPSFRVYEAGYVKEGVGAGGCAIYAYLSKRETSSKLVTRIEDLFSNYRNLRLNAISE